jgi:hypothetical protein
MDSRAACSILGRCETFNFSGGFMLANVSSSVAVALDVSEILSSNDLSSGDTVLMKDHLEARQPAPRSAARPAPPRERPSPDLRQRAAPPRSSGALLARHRGRPTHEWHRLGVSRPVALRLLQPVHRGRATLAQRQHADLRGLPRPHLRGHPGRAGRVGVRESALLLRVEPGRLEQLGLPSFPVFLRGDRAGATRLSGRSRAAARVGSRPWDCLIPNASGAGLGLLYIGLGTYEDYAPGLTDTPMYDAGARQVRR